LDVRIGIHTGEVLASEPASGGNPLLIGDTPNIAKRLEEAAQPGTVLVSATTMRLIEHAFVGEPLGQLSLKGLPFTIAAYRIERDRGNARTLDLFETRALARLVGRDQERVLLDNRWTLAREGRGQFVMISGEPGIGKSRLVHAFATALEPGSCALFATQCQEQFANSALFPIVTFLQRELGMRPEDPATDKLEKLEAAFRSGRLPRPDAFALVASLLSLPSAGTAPDASPRLLREQTLEWLSNWILGDSELRPVVVVIEDVHWADASTLEFLSLLVEQVTSRRAIIVLTFRPEFTPPWPMRSHFSQLALTRLPAAATGDLARNVARGMMLPKAMLEHIVVRSDGVPLFVEELTKMLLETGAIGPNDRQAAPARIPETLRGSLVARLDHLSQSKPLAQCAAVLGRQFPYKLLQLVSQHTEEELRAGLRELVDAELLFQRGWPPEATYAFKHALIQDAAYLSLPKARRAEYHDRTAQVLVEQFGELIESHPELAAHHFSMAGHDDRAGDYWYRAGARALESSADVEAVAYLRKALQQLATAPYSPSSVAEEVRCLITLGSALTAILGYGAAEVETTFARACELSETLGDTDQLYAALTGLHSFYQVRGQLRNAVEVGRRLVRIADDGGTPLRRAQAYRCLGWSLFCNGQLRAGSSALQVALGLFDHMRAQQHTRVHGAHPWVVGFVNSALLEWFAGRTEESLVHSRNALSLARELRQPLALAYALCMSAAVHCYRREPLRTLELAREVVELSTQHGLPYWVAWGSSLLGWALVQTGDPQAGIAQLMHALERYRATDAQLFEPSTLAVLAECLCKAGEPGKAMEALDTAFRSPMLEEGYFCAAELLRVRAEVLQVTGAPDKEMESCLTKAIELARTQGAYSLELRAAAPLARVWHERGESTTAAELLHVAIERFAGQPESADLAAARSTLEMVAGQRGQAAA
jgi:tetratricopeptide (TPR) repeat protein